MSCRPLRVAPAALLILAACTGGATRTPAADSTAAVAAGSEAPADTLLSLERTPCFGFCPVYRLSFLSGGRVVLAGTAPNASFRKELRVPAARVDSLARAMATGGFLALDTAYFPGSADCQHAATDHPGSIVTLWQAGTRHEVRYYHGCYPSNRVQEAPAGIRQLLAWEDAIDSLGRTGEWVDSLRGR